MCKTGATTRACSTLDPDRHSSLLSMTAANDIVAFGQQVDDGRPVRERQRKQVA
jgi:hypothetical protein